MAMRQICGLNVPIDSVFVLNDKSVVLFWNNQRIELFVPAPKAYPKVIL